MKSRNRRKVMKSERAIEWIRANPGAGESAAVAAGFTKSTYYLARRKMKTLALTRPTEVTVQATQVVGADHYRELAQKLKDMGVHEMHYADGTLRIGIIIWSEVKLG